MKLSKYIVIYQSRLKDLSDLRTCLDSLQEDGKNLASSVQVSLLDKYMLLMSQLDNATSPEIKRWVERVYALSAIAKENKHLLKSALGGQWPATAMDSSYSYLRAAYFSLKSAELELIDLLHREVPSQVIGNLSLHAYSECVPLGVKEYGSDY